MVESQLREASLLKDVPLPPKTALYTVGVSLTLRQNNERTSMQPKFQHYPVIVALLATSAAFGKCGQERWNVKTGLDPAARSINLTSPKSLTISEGRAFLRPTGSLPATRIANIETTAYEVKARLKAFKLETDDSDYHLVLSDDAGNTFVAEIPSPSCALGSAWHAEITSTRVAMNEAFMPGTKFQNVDVPVVIKGIGFFDKDHGATGQQGHAPNNFEIHPILSIEFEGDLPPRVTSTVSSLPSASAPSSDQGTSGTGREPAGAAAIDFLYWTIFWVITAMYVLIFVGVVIPLRRTPGWSLAGALYETDASGAGKPSASRIIAFFGSLVLMIIFIGVGYCVIWDILHSLPLPNINGFLLTGMSLFAPYAANQFKSMITGAGTAPGSGGGGGAVGGGGVSGGGSSPEGVGGTRQSGAATISSPKVFSVTPGSVTGGTTSQITIAGAGFSNQATVSVSTPNGIVSPAVTIAANQIQFTTAMPAQGAPYISTVRISNPDGGNTTGSFQVTS